MSHYPRSGRQGLNDMRKRKTVMCRRAVANIECPYHLSHNCWFAHDTSELRCMAYASGYCPLEERCDRKHTRIDASAQVAYADLNTLRVTTIGHRPDLDMPDYLRSLPLLDGCVNAQLLYNVADSAKAAQRKKGHYGVHFLQDKYIIIRCSFNNNSPKLALREAWEDDTKARHLLKDLLQVEVAQSISDVRQYDIEDAVLTKVSLGSNVLYRITCDGLAEKRPSVLRQDRVKVRDNQTMKWHEGFVWFVNLDHVVVSFGDNFSPSARTTFLVIFSVPLTNFRKQFLALEDAPVMTESFFRNCVADPIRNVPFVPSLEATRKLNALQQEAVRRIVEPCVPGKLGVFLLHGPPGTGKTTTVVAAIAELLKQPIAESTMHAPRKLRILVSTPSNEAANLVIERLAKLPELLKEGTHLRVVGLSLDVAKQCSENVQTFVMRPSKIGLRGSFDYAQVELMVTTMMTAGTVFSLGYDPGYFDHIIVDEAGQATETELMVPLCFASPEHGTRITLAGDHKQLGPILRSVACQAYDFGQSTLQRLMKSDFVQSNFSLQLLDSYRAHPTILDLYNTLTYKNSLIARAPKAERELLVGSKLLPNPEHPIAFYHVEGEEKRKADSPSWFNEEEANAVLALLDNLLRAQVDLKFDDIVVLAPYLKQCQHIRDALHHYRFIPFQSSRSSVWYCPDYQRSLMPIRVCSVESFQGREAKVVILTCVRSKSLEVVGMDQRQGIGFLKQPQRLNVAISRPISALFIVGNAATLCSDKNWEELLQLMRIKYNAVCDTSAQPLSAMKWSAIQRSGAALRVQQSGQQQHQGADQLDFTTKATFDGATVEVPPIDTEWNIIE